MKYRPLSKKLNDAVRLSPIRKYKLAKKAGLHQSHFSQILNGIVLTRVGDERIKEIGKQLDLKPEECWEEAE